MLIMASGWQSHAAGWSVHHFGPDMKYLQQLLNEFVEDLEDEL